jgi:2',3'-cyclic-nucleotide 2'-phosphodiesterase/3'-nucleotidase
MAVAMNLLSYDVMALGNHEFNYGMDVLNKFVKEANFPVLGANVRKSDGAEAFPPYIMKEVCGVRVGILGLVTPGVTTWERPENIPRAEIQRSRGDGQDLRPRAQEQRRRRSAHCGAQRSRSLTGQAVRSRLLAHRLRDVDPQREPTR